jgi:hypothetical protein
VSEAQHTSGPWKVFGVRRNQYLAVIDSIPDRDGKVVANCICHVATSNPDADANARLLAAAPDLFAIVKEIRSDGPNVDDLAAMDAAGNTETADWWRRVDAMIERIKQAEN